MSADTNNFNVGANSALPNPEAHRVDQKDLISGKDSRAQANNVVMPPQPAIRSENNDSEGA